MQLRPTAADEFHVVLVRQVLDTLALESRSNEEFVESIRNEWLIAAATDPTLLGYLRRR